MIVRVLHLHSGNIFGGIESMLSHAHRTHFVPGLLGEGATDLRSLLVEGIEQWGQR